MSTKEKAPKAVEIKTFNASLQTAYASLIESGEGANIDSINFILELGDLLSEGTSQKVAEDSMRETLKGVNVKPVVLPSHVKSTQATCAIIVAYNDEAREMKASKLLSLGARVLADVKATGIAKHLQANPTLKELDENTLTKAESQARDKGEALTEAVTESAKEITLETVIDAVDAYLKGHDLKTLTTTELAKLDSTIQKLITVAKNTKALTA